MQMHQGGYDGYDATAQYYMQPAMQQVMQGVMGQVCASLSLHTHTHTHTQLALCSYFPAECVCVVCMGWMERAGGIRRV
jgi:hypothetical protein